MLEETDQHVGILLDYLKQVDELDDTYFIFTSDNGPWLSYGTHAGSSGPLREGKGTAWEGGVREPCIMRWPGKIPAGTVCNIPAMNIDLLPTIAGLIDADLPERKIDGKDIWPILSGEDGAETVSYTHLRAHET